MLTYVADQKVPTWCPTGDCKGGSDAAFHIGPSYFDAFKRFQSAHFTFQAPLGPHANGPNAAAYVQHAYSAAGASRVNAIALGNEVNWYVGTAENYVGNASIVKDAIKSVIKLNDPIWEILDSAVASTKAYTVPEVFDKGINDDSLVKYVAYHYYQYSDKENRVTEQLLSQNALKTKFDPYLDPIRYTTEKTKAKFIFSETGGPLIVQDDQPEEYYFANTLWSVNFRLYAMACRVSRVEGTQRPATLRSLWLPKNKWVPEGDSPRVQAPYYALPFVADFIGKTVSGKRGVINLDLAQDSISGYAMFEGNSLARVAIVNLRPYDGNGARKGASIHLVNLGSTSQVRVRRLHAAAGMAAGGFDVNKKNITYAGQQWSYDVDEGKGHGPVEEETVAVTKGAVDIVIADTEAVIVYIKPAN